MESSPTKVSYLHHAKPLQGYSFYIDVEDDEDGCNLVEILSGKIASLGGNVRKGLSQNVLYFITARNQKSRVKIRRSGRFLKQNETRAKTKGRNIPILKKTDSRDSPIISTIDRAKKLGLNIFTVDKVNKWLTEIERRRHASPTKSEKGKDGGENLDNSIFHTSMDKDDALHSLSRVRLISRNNDEELSPPYIKVEDKQKIFEPQFLELSVFPTISWNSSAPRCPFQKIDLNNKTDDTKNDSDGESKSISSTSNYSRSGYCDFCESFFRCRDRHIQSKKHQFNIPYENFKKLDDLVTNGGSFDEFLKSMMKKKITEEVYVKMDRNQEITELLMTLEAKKKTREFFSIELNQIVQGISDSSKNVIR